MAHSKRHIAHNGILVTVMSKVDPSVMTSGVISVFRVKDWNCASVKYRAVLRGNQSMEGKRTYGPRATMPFFAVMNLLERLSDRFSKHELDRIKFEASNKVWTHGPQPSSYLDSYSINDRCHGRSCKRRLSHEQDAPRQEDIGETVQALAETQSRDTCADPKMCDSQTQTEEDDHSKHIKALREHLRRYKNCAGCRVFVEDLSPSLKAFLTE